MMVRSIFLGLALSLTLMSGFPTRVAAQVPASIAVSDAVWEIQLRDGSTVIGSVTGVEGDELAILSQGGARVQITRDQIRSMRPRGETLRRGEIWPEDTNTTRLFFGPTARSQPQGHGYIAAYELFLPFLSYSVTDWLTIAGGTPIIPGVIGDVFYLAPKVSLYQRSDLAIAAGVLSFFSTYEDVESAGIAYGVGTVGGADRSLTGGVGFPFASGDLASVPVFMAGGESRLSRRIKFVSENYLVTLDDGSVDEIGGILSGGVRFIGDRLSADLGLAYAFDGDDGACCLPMVNFVYHLGED